MCGRSRGQTHARREALWASLVLAVASVAAASAGRAAEDRYVREIDLAPDTPISLEITNGRVIVNGTSRPNLRVDVVRRAPSADGVARMPVAIEGGVGGVQIRVIQDAGGTAAELMSDVTLDLPSTASVTAIRVGEGRLDIHDFRGRLTAAVRRGPITATRVSGALRLETVMGDVDVRDARLAADGVIRLRAFNGDVRLAFAAVPVDARIMALALNGTITSAIPLRVKDAWGPRWAEATLGKGDPVVSLDVVNGAIAIETTASRAVK